MWIVRYNGRTDPKLIVENAGNPGDLEKGQLYEVQNEYLNGAAAIYELRNINGHFPASYFCKVAISFDQGATRTWSHLKNGHLVGLT